MFKIIPASPNTDFHAVAQLYYDTWQDAYRGLVPQAYLDSLTPETWHPEKHQKTTLLATMDDRIVGVCSFGAARDSAYQGIGELRSLYVHPVAQHLGIGRALLQGAVARLTEQYRSCYLVVLEKNVRAIALYESEGFKITSDKRSQQTPFGALQEIVLGKGDYFI